MSLSRNGLVLDAIEVFNLGRKTETEHVTSQNPFLRFAIGSQTYKTETKKHVGAHAVFQDSLRFNATPGDELQVSHPATLSGFTGSNTGCTWCLGHCLCPASIHTTA